MPIHMNTPWLSKIRFGKARGDFGGRSVADYMSPSKSGSNAVQNGFWDDRLDGFKKAVIHQELLQLLAGGRPDHVTVLETQLVVRDSA